MEPERIKAAQARSMEYLGLVCPNCGFRVRYVSTGKCTACTKAKAKTRYDEQKRILDEARGK